MNTLFHTGSNGRVPVPPQKRVLINPSTYLLDGHVLQKMRQRVQAGDPALADNVAELRRRADRFMQGELWSVTSKPFAGPSGDKQDYVSLASYFWPDPDAPDGLPYILRDGVLNPETLEYDRTRLEAMSRGVHVMALAHYLTGEASYGERAVAQLRVWFLDKNTRMNPHLTNAQMVKGRNEGNSFGLIETEELTKVVDAVMLLRASGIWADDDDEKLRRWFVEYLTWLRTSDLGKQEDAAPNNHGMLYDVQTVVFALYTGQNDLAREIVENVKVRRIATQIEPDGSQPYELRRTQSWSYTLLNLTGMFHLARLSEHVEVDLWNYKSDDGRGIRQVLDWVVPYIDGKPWEHEQISRFAHEPLVYLLREAAAAYQEPAYEHAIARLSQVDLEILWIDLLYPPRMPEQRTMPCLQP
jgi:hypothetical protein